VEEVLIGLERETKVLEKENLALKARAEKAEKKNAELKAEVAGWQRGEAKVKEAMDKVYDERDNWKRNYEALKARAEKAEAERDKAAEERGVWESEAHRLAGIVSEQTGQIENVETGARECRVTLGAERKDYEQVKAKLSQANGTIAELDQLTDEFKARAEKAEAKLAGIEKDLRDILKALYCPDEGYLEIETSEIYNDIHGLLGKHFPTKKAKEPELCGVCGGKRGLCLCLDRSSGEMNGVEGTPKKVATR